MFFFFFFSKMPKRRAPILFHRKLGIVASLHHSDELGDPACRDPRDGIIGRTIYFRLRMIPLFAGNGGLTR